MLIINFLRSYVKKHRKKVIFYILVTCLLWAIGIFPPFLMGIYIDVLVEKQPIKIIAGLMIIIAIIELLFILSQYLGTYASTKLNNIFLYDISNDIFQKIFKAKLSEFKKIDTAYLIDQITTDAANIVSFFSNNITSVFLQGITIIICGLIVLRVDMIMCIIVFSLLPIYIISYLAFRNRLYAANLKFKEETNEYYSKKVEQINKLEFIKKNVVENEMEKRFNKAFQSMYKVAVSQVKTNYIFSNLNQLIFVICYISVISIGGYKVWIGELSIGFLTIISTYFSMIISSATYFLNLAGNFQETKISIERINRIINAEEELHGKDKINYLDKIQIEKFSIKYDEKDIINNLNIKFEKGKIYAIKGQNGAGKTTLINAIVGLYSDLYDGDIFFNDLSIKQIDMPFFRRKNINYVVQEPDFLNLSINEYLRFGIDTNQVTEDYQQQLISIMNLQKYLSVCTKKQKLISENGSNFSGGEKQKFAIVRGLCKDSMLTILDEPTAALDSGSVHNLLKWLGKEKDKRITLIITHDKRVLDICDETLNL